MAQILNALYLLVNSHGASVGKIIRLPLLWSGADLQPLGVDFQLRGAVFESLGASLPCRREASVGKIPVAEMRTDGHLQASPHIPYMHYSNHR